MAGRLRTLPKKLWLDESYYILVRVVPQAEIGGDEGQWDYNPRATEGCFGVIRVSKEPSSFVRWLCFREELQHALIDFQRWILHDHANNRPAYIEHTPEDSA